MANFKDELTPTGQTWIATRHNVKAAEWAEVAVLAFREACGGEMDETALYDLVANLGHLCDRLTAEFEDFDMDFDSMVERAMSHYEAERGAGDDLAQAWDAAAPDEED
jgi:hypothetical protein